MMQKVKIELIQFGEIEVNALILDPNYRLNYGLKRDEETEVEKSKKVVEIKETTLKKRRGGFNGWF